MRKVVGSFIIIISLPLLFFLFDKIALEIKTANTLDGKFASSIQLEATNSLIPTVLRDQNKETFSEEYTEWRKPMKLADIPEFVQELFLYSEDEHFYDHIGFDLSAIARAAVVNSASGESSQGGSTITQQLVRMRYLSEEKSYERKLLELFYSYELEQKTAKDEILNMYLNEMYFSNGTYGIGGASTYYFQRPVSKLSKAEMAFLAAIPNNPTLYDPVKHFDNTKKRQERLINKLVDKGVLTAKQGKNIKKENITLTIKKKKQQYPAYSTYVLNELHSLISDKEGFTKQLKAAKTSADKQAINKKLTKRVNTLLNEGLIIDTALSPTKQIADQNAIDQAVSYTSELQAAAVVIDNTSREIVSIYGGKDYEKFDFNRAFQGVRQPGSAFKPLIDYAPYFELTSATPNTIVSGSPFCIGSYCPQNYGGQVIGNVSLQQGFRYSYNTVAMRLFHQIGTAKAFSFLKPFQFESITNADHVYSAAIGGLTHGVTALELADAYTSFINGDYEPAHAIRQVKSRDGKVLYEWEQKQMQVWSASTTQHMRTLLGDVVHNGTGVGIHVNAPYVGAKTGTTNDYRDYWLAGLTDRYTSAVWIGYDRPRNMYWLENAKIHHRIFSSIMQ
ncbi:penicillin-binding protein [Viridibacillus sp. YIM B01967]|uniref:Penicillin-binding protein n=1 Tax=Viridibacillus soli TaxID=2798301 RepID=A0ABS1H9U2_9BACL|nr:transglycosylase domain-containing protein [Viridibacillus soli]MBK3496190.1 penicillin-binding protein [Viridibacillus soli]